MTTHHKDSLTWIQYPNIPITHATFTNTHDFTDSATTALISKTLNIPLPIRAPQIHSTTLTHVTSPDQTIPPSDGLLTNIPNIPLLILHADCQAAILYDPKNHALALIHAGWKGLVNDIYPHTVAMMTSLFNTCPEDLLVAISPSLGPSNAQFTNYLTEIPPSLHSFQPKPLYFDLKAIARYQLIEAGLLPSHIYTSPICTYDSPEHFYSYRRSKTSKRNATLSILNT